MSPRFTTPANPLGSGLRFRLSYTVDPAGTGTPRIALAGELSLTTADRARAAIQHAQCEAPDLICDLAEVTFVDVSGVCVLLDVAARAQQRGEGFTVVNPPPIVPRILRLFGLAGSLRIDAEPVRAARPADLTGRPTRAEVCNVTVRPHGGRSGGRDRRPARRPYG